MWGGVFRLCTDNSLDLGAHKPTCVLLQASVVLVREKTTVDCPPCEEECCVIRSWALGWAGPCAKLGVDLTLKTGSRSPFSRSPDRPPASCDARSSRLSGGGRRRRFTKRLGRLTAGLQDYYSSGARSTTTRQARETARVSKRTPQVRLAVRARTRDARVCGRTWAGRCELYAAARQLRDVSMSVAGAARLCRLGEALDLRRRVGEGERCAHAVLHPVHRCPPPRVFPRPQYFRYGGVYSEATDYSSGCTDSIKPVLLFLTFRPRLGCPM